MLLTLALVCVSVSGTIAYLTDSEQKENLTGFTDNTIHLEEDFVPPVNPGPGTVIKKSPRIVNESEIPVYVRLSARFSDDQAESFCLPLEINAGWELQPDGYYYYSRALTAGEKTSALFDEVVIRAETDKEDLVPFDLLIYAESVQSYGMTQEEAWTYFEKS